MVTPWDRAFEAAKQAGQQGEVPVGAVVVYQNRIIGIGANRRERDQQVMAHAEIIALMHANHHERSWRLKGAEVYVTLEPCLMCLGALRQARVSKIYYASHDPKAGDFTFHKIEAGTLCPEYQERSQKLLREFFQMQRGKKNQE